MNTAHVHLLLNHVSILAALFSAFVYAWGLLKKDYSIQLVALVGFVIAALAAIPVFLTGEGAEDLVENMSGVSKSMIEEHEETANIALWLVEILGVASLFQIITKKLQWKLATKMPFPILLLALIAAGSIGYTGYIGGKIHHTEIYNNATGGTIENGTGGGEEHDDD